MVPLIILVSLTSSLQLFFIGLLGEYILSMNKRLMNRPLVVEEERLNSNRRSRNRNNALSRLEIV